MAMMSGANSPANPSAVTVEAIDKAITNLHDKISARIAGIEKGIEIFQQDMVRVPTLLDRSVLGVREIIETRLDGMDKAIELLQVATNKVPALVKDEVMQLRQLHEEKFRSVDVQADTRFDGIATQFAERDKRTEQLSLADKTAIAAALQAQKEAAGAQNESNAAANAKTETNFAKLIEQNQTLLLEVRRNTEAQINDLKSRLDKGEGKTSVSDPALALAMRDISSLIASNNQKTGSQTGISMVGSVALGAVAIVAVLISIATLVFNVVRV